MSRTVTTFTCFFQVEAAPHQILVDSEKSQQLAANLYADNAK